MGINRACITDGEGFTKDLSEDIERSRRLANHEAPTEVQVETWYTVLGFTYSQEPGACCSHPPRRRR